jgi:hypothetical protein
MNWKERVVAGMIILWGAGLAVGQLSPTNVPPPPPTDMSFMTNAPSLTWVPTNTFVVLPHEIELRYFWVPSMTSAPADRVYYPFVSVVPAEHDQGFIFAEIKVVTP